MAETGIDLNNSILDKILTNNLSIGLKDALRELLEFTFLVDEFIFNLYSPFTIFITKAFRNRYCKLINKLILLDSCNTLARVVLTSIKYKIESVTYYRVK